jgi:hypothetical protein
MEIIGYIGLSLLFLALAILMFIGFFAAFADFRAKRKELKAFLKDAVKLEATVVEIKRVKCWISRFISMEISVPKKPYGRSVRLFSASLIRTETNRSGIHLMQNTAMDFSAKGSFTRMYRT